LIACIFEYSIWDFCLFLSSCKLFQAFSCEFYFSIIYCFSWTIWKAYFIYNCIGLSGSNFNFKPFFWNLILGISDFWNNKMCALRARKLFFNEQSCFLFIILVYVAIEISDSIWKNILSYWRCSMPFKIIFPYLFFIIYVLIFIGNENICQYVYLLVIIR